MRGTVEVVIGVGAVTAALLGTSATAAAQDPPLPNCTAADLAGVSAGVTAATSAYLFTQPEVNTFFTGLQGQPPDHIRAQVQQYVEANPQVKAAFRQVIWPQGRHEFWPHYVRLARLARLARVVVLLVRSR